MIESRKPVMLATMDQIFLKAKQSTDANNPGKAIAEYRKAFTDCESLPYAVKDTYGIASAHFNLGSLLVKAGKPEEAEKQYHSALAVDPTNMQAVLNMAYIYKDYLNKPRRAIYYFKRFLEFDPPEGDVRNAETELLKLRIQLKG